MQASQSAWESRLEWAYNSGHYRCNLSENLDDTSNCEAETISFSNGKTLSDQAAQELSEIFLREEFVEMNELTGIITMALGVQALIADKSLVASLEGTMVWEYDPMACLKMILQLYKGLMKVYMNQTKIYEGITAVLEHKDKDQAVRMKIAEFFILCSHQAYKMHINRIAIFIHNDDRVEVAWGRSPIRVVT